MRRAIAPVCWLLVSALGAAGACSSDGASSPEASAGADGTGAHAGAAAVLGGDGSGASAARAGAANHAGGVGETGGATAGGVDNAAAGAAMAEAGGEAGAGGGSGSSNPEPDLVTSSGGPWPDSLTGVCSTASQVGPCPQLAQPFFGQDGTYRINVPSYTATTTTLTDSVTGLVWQLTPDQAPKTHAEALAYCEDLQLAGQSDWRLPSLLEYVSVLDEGMGSGYAMPSAFGFDTVGAQWTASASGIEADQFFSMNDQYGEWTLSVEATPLGARCVRGTAPSGALLSQTDVVTDSRTGLVPRLKSRNRQAFSTLPV